MPERAEEWITPPRVAERLGLRLRTVHGLIERGELPAEIIMGRGRRNIRVRRQDVDDYLDRARVKPGELRHLHPHWSWERHG